MSEPWSLYTAPSDLVDATMLRQFVNRQVSTGGLRETISLEIKREPSRQNIAKAVAALANADGGILLVGLDENTPDWDNATGVPRDTAQVQVAEQCRIHLTPTYVPEIIEVELPHNPGHTILVVRVAAATELAPIVCSGTVFRRVPGASPPATHDDIVRLVNRRNLTSATTTFSTQALINCTPEDRAPSVGEFLPDAIIRVAGAIWLRPAAVQDLYLARRVRDALMAAMNSSPIGIMLKQRLPQTDKASAWHIHEISSAHYRTARRFAIGSDSVELALRLALDGPRIVSLLDVAIRPREVTLASPVTTNSRAHLGLDEAVAVVDALLSTTMHSLPAAIEELRPGGVSRLETPVGWILTPARPIVTVLNVPLTQVGPTPNRHSIVISPTVAAEDPGKRREMLRDWIDRSLLDLGYPETEQLVHQIFTGDLALPGQK